MTNNEKQKCFDLLSLFELNGETFDELVTEGQLEIFYNLVFRPKDRTIIITPTQYGKSLITALACVIIACIQEEVIAIVAPSKEKAKIIMRYFIEHLGDNPMFYSQLEKNTKLERLRQEESKERVILRNGGGIYTLSVNARNSKKMIESAMGQGAKIVIQDESCLIPDEAESTIFRMIGGKGSDAFYCKIGNPFYKQKPHSHFYQTWKDSEYQKVFIDYKQGLKEGRFTKEFIKEAKKKPNFDILYECKFPEGERVDSKGYRPLVTDKILDDVLVDKVEFHGKPLLGVDPAGGGVNYSAIVKRTMNGAKLLYREQNPDLMSFTGEIARLAEYHRVKPENVVVDNVGMGKGVVDRLRETFGEVEAVNAGSKARNNENFQNVRAEGYWKLRRWLEEGGKLESNEVWDELLDIRYKIQSDKRVKIMSKDAMSKKGIPSPDVADALMLTFCVDPKKRKAKVYKPGQKKKKATVVKGW